MLTSDCTSNAKPTRKRPGGSAKRKRPIGGLAAHVDRFLAKLDARGCKYRETRTPYRWQIQCPGHDDDDPSAVLSVADDGGLMLWCTVPGCPFHSRDAEVRLEGFKEYLDMEPHELWPKSRWRAERRAERYGQLVERYHQKLLADEPQMAQLAEREGWNRGAIVSLRIGRLRDWITFPGRDARKRVIGIDHYLPRRDRLAAQRRIEHPFVGKDGQEVMPSGRDQRRARGHHSEGERGLIARAGGPSTKRIVLVEGGSCTAAVYSLGFDGVGIASASVGDNVKLAARRLLKGCEVYILPDGDLAGLRAAETMAELLLPVADYLAVCEPLGSPGVDLADLLRDQGANAAASKLEDAMSKAVPRRRRGRGRPPNAMEAAKRFIALCLGDGEWHRVEDIEAKMPGTFGLRTFKKARKALKVEARQTSHGWEIRLPPRDQEASISSAGTSSPIRRLCAFLPPAPIARIHGGFDNA